MTGFNLSLSLLEIDIIRIFFFILIFTNIKFFMIWSDKINFYKTRLNSYIPCVLVEDKNHCFLSF